MYNQFVSCCLVLIAFSTTDQIKAQETNKEDRKRRTRKKNIELNFESLASIPGSDKWDWWQGRTAFVPGQNPFWISTMSETGKAGRHNFHDIYQAIRQDGGKSWTMPDFSEVNFAVYWLKLSIQTACFYSTFALMRRRNQSEYSCEICEWG